MILENKGKPFEIRFDGRGFTIPEGKFEVVESLGKHIIATVSKWENADVVIVDNTPKGDVIPEKREETPVEPVKEAPLPEEEPMPEPEIEAPDSEEV